MTGVFRPNLTPTRLFNSCCLTHEEEEIMAIYASILFRPIQTIDTLTP
jgi:hypothetical protein